MEQRDRLIQGMAWSGNFRIIAAQTTQAVETARLKSDLSPVATAAIGRAMTGAVLLARLLDKKMRNQWVTLRFEGGGPLGSLIAEGTVSGNVRAFVSNPHVDDERVNVGAAVGARGNLTVVRGTPPEGVPYTSQVSLVSGEIAKDLAHYLARSEQIASAVLLGVMIRPSGVDAAGGMLVQALPQASESAIETMEKRISEAPAFSTLLDRMTLEEAVQEVLRGSDYKLLDPSFNIPIRYSCSCTRERALKGFAYFSLHELSEIITEGGSEAVCQFCGQKYFFSGDDLLALSTPPDA